MTALNVRWTAFPSFGALASVAPALLCGLVAWFGVAQSALAQEPPAENDAEGADERPKMSFTVAPNEPPVQRSDYVHNGFYFRFGVGPGYMYNSVRSKSANDSVDAHAFALSADLLVGGSPSPGMSLGGGAIVTLAPSANYGGPNETPLHFTVGPFFDAFPNDRAGFHLGALLGVSGLTGFPTRSDEDAEAIFGGGAAGWLGYDMWVAPEWSAGFSLQFGGSFHSSSAYSGAVFHTTLMLTILRN